MCGIFGFFLFDKSNDLNEHSLKLATESLKHRGPDANGSWFSEKDGIYLGHRRLSILDLSNKGNQPMISNCGRFVITFNGEIYNYRELALYLKTKYRLEFKNGTDTTVLLELISKFGLKKTLSLIEGMFAFALWDKKIKKLYIARDRFGEKPLFYYRNSSFLMFSSELKAIKALCGPKLKISSNSSFYYSLLGYIPAPLSIYEDIFKVMPSEFIELDMSKGIKKKKYYFINSENKHKKVSYSILKEQIQEGIEDSIKKMMIADVEVGCFLSGGVDSSLVAMLMQKNSTKKIRTFTVAFNEKEYDESDYAKEIADLVGTNHKEIKVNINDMIVHLDKLIDIFDEPFSDSSFIPTYLISKLASNDVKVVLSGDGGDEVFLGYNRYLFSRKIDNFKKYSPEFLRSCLSYFLNKVPSNYYDRASEPFQKMLGIHGFSHKIQKLSNVLNFKNNSDYYRKLNSFDSDILKCKNNRKDKFFQNYQNFSLLESVQMNDIDYYLPNDILVKVDRSSMSNSLEVRSPFLNHKLVNEAFKLPLESKLKRNSTKYILKDLLSDYMPRSFSFRPKMGFAIPIERWIKKKKFSSMIDNIFYESDWEKFGWENKTIINKWENFKKFKSYTPQCIWMYTVAGIWLNKNK